MLASWPTAPARTLLSDLVTALDEVLPQATKLRRTLHTNPRLSGNEADTAARIRRALRRPGEDQTFTKVAGTGFLYRVGPQDGPAVAVRAEMDALPIDEATGVPWSSAVPGVMHACGHDVHMAATWALLEAARRVEVPSGLVAIFQPREEGQPSGARDVVASQLLGSQDVGAIIGAHLQPRMERGIVSTGVGGVNAAADEFEITIHGYGGHGAYPHVTIDPIAILGAVLSGIHQVISRNIDPTHPAVVTVGQVQAGTAHNIIPDRAVVKGIIRATTEGDRQRLHADLRRLVQYTASARGGTADISIVTGDPVLNNDKRLVRAIDPMIEATGLPVAADSFRSCGADDFSHYIAAAPIVMMFVGTGHGPTTDGRHSVGLHHAEFLPGEETIRQVALALAAGYVGASHVVGRL